MAKEHLSGFRTDHGQNCYKNHYWGASSLCPNMSNSPFFNNVKLLQCNTSLCVPTLNVSLSNPGTCFRPGDDWQSRETTWNWRESSQRPTLNLLFFNILQIGKLASVYAMLPSCSEQAVIIEVVQRNYLITLSLKDSIRDETFRESSTSL